MERLKAYITLNLIPGIGPARVRQLLTALASPEAILEAPSSKLAQVPGIGAKLAETISAWRRNCDPDGEIDIAQRAGVQIICCENERYPQLLRQIDDPPLVLYLCGDPAVLQAVKGGISIVGSRRTTTYGVGMADRLATAAAVAGWPVVSGLANGIDTSAHEATLRAGGCTIAVLGSGLGQIYPRENINLARQISGNGGLLLSEFPMLMRPDKRTFPMRNRIISGLTRGTVVVEAGFKSGSLITAATALEQGRLVFAVPGRVDSPQSRGCHALIKDGAKLTESFQDVAEEFSMLPGLNVGRKDYGGAKAPSEDILAADDTLTELERRLLSLLSENGEMGIDDLVAHVGEAAPTVLGGLLMLEMKRLVQQLPGKRVACVRGKLG